jgi:hypothetical protein
MAEEEQDSVGPGVEQRSEIVVGVDRTDEQVLNLNLDEGVKLVWDAADFRKLPAAVVDQLRRENLVAYVKAESAAEAAERYERSREPKQVGPKRQLDPLGMYAAHRMQSLEPKAHIEAGWHLYWAAPGQDFETKIAGQYRQVRKQRDGEDEPVGEENGEVIQIKDGDGKVELILLECPEKLFQEHLQWQSAQSRQQFEAVGDTFEGSIEELNRGLKKKERMRVLKGNE